MDLLWVGVPQGCRQCQKLSIWGSWGCRLLCVCVSVCASVCLCVCQALWLSPGATRHPQECGSSRLPELPRLHMEVAARKREGRGREKGGRVGGRKKSPEPAVRRAQTQRQTKDSSSHRFPGEAWGEALRGQTPSGRRQGRLRDVPACVYGARGAGASPLGRGRVAVGRGCALEQTRRGAPVRVTPSPGLTALSPGKGCQAPIDLTNITPS